MAILDVLILISLVMGLWQGFSAGLLKSLVGLFGWLFALIFATYFAKPLAPMLAGLFETPVLTPVLTLLAAFILVALFLLVGLHLILWVMSHTLKKLKLSILDKLAGAFFGVGKNFLIILLLLSMIAPFIQQTKFFNNTIIAKQLLPLTPFAVDLSKKIANEVKNNSQQGFEHLDKIGQDLENQ
ncbi:colicin V production protein [Moraxella macacae 0408225]|uniref:Colicin V production protein n=1 Tax=Moraxella macacae 0408225 TaxID=1230338 RepID=L2F5A8_9GAMM|nr:CvpA family protein [Moraxella macacae]ELA08239.1 colicin V production protein [Moraxella macacae 0408225]